MWRSGLLALVLAGCTQFPELDRTIEPGAEAADFPDLVPLEPILAAQASPEKRSQQAQETREAEETVAARQEALRARADTLRGGVIDPETQDRMRRGVGGE